MMMRLAPGSLPHTLLRDLLGQREATPLEPSIRGFFEAQLHTSLGDLRIHAGPVAGTLSALLHARAFTFGRDIFFDEGQYAPATVAGRRLLAHELVHVLQQRS